MSTTTKKTKKKTSKKAAKKAAKKKAPAKRGPAKPRGKHKQIVQVQIYLRPAQVEQLEDDRAQRESEVQELMGVGRRVSRSAHSGSVLSNYIRCRQLADGLSYEEFWGAVEKAVLAKAKKKKR